MREFSDRFSTWFENNNLLTLATKRFHRYGLNFLARTRLIDMPLARRTAEVIRSTTFRRSVYDRKLKVETDTIVDCPATYITKPCGFSSL